MIIYTKYSNERSLAFRIRTDILLTAEGEKQVRKLPASPEAKTHIASISRNYELLKNDLRHTGISINRCEIRSDGLYFPYREGKTLEEKLDQFLAQNERKKLVAEIERYFAMFDVKDTAFEFVCTPEFEQVFGKTAFSSPQYCRRVSDIDMIFANAIEWEQGFELIDYEWTFAFPVPVKFIWYRCLHYYMLGNPRRAGLNSMELYAHFGISKEEQEQFAAMEAHFQQYMLGEYVPYWKLYDAVSDGVINVQELIAKESAWKQQNKVEIYFDDGCNFGAWNCEKRCSAENQRLELEILTPPKTRAVRIDPCSEPCVVRVKNLSQNGCCLPYTSNGYKGGNGDLIFDTQDPQIVFQVSGQEPVQISMIVEPMKGISRELILNQYGKLRRLQLKTYINKAKRLFKHS